MTTEHCLLNTNGFAPSSHLLSRRSSVDTGHENTGGRQSESTVDPALLQPVFGKNLNNSATPSQPPPRAGEEPAPLLDVGEGPGVGLVVMKNLNNA